MCVFAKILIITFCLCVSPKLFNSIQIPVQIDNLKDVREVSELLMLCCKFMDLKMRDGTIYTETDEKQAVLYKGTAKFIDYKLPVLNKTLFEIWDDTTVDYLLPEFPLRIINVVESVGVFLLIKISMLVNFVVELQKAPQVLFKAVVIPYLDKISKKFNQLSIPRTPVEHLRGIIRPYTYEIDIKSTDAANFEKECIRFMETYIYLVGFVDMEMNLTNFNPNIYTPEEFLNVELKFITKNVDNYFIHIPVDDKSKPIAPTTSND